MALGSEVVGVMDPRGPGGMRYGKAKEATEARTRMVRARRRKMGE